MTRPELLAVPPADEDDDLTAGVYPPGHPLSPLPLRNAREAGALIGRGPKWLNAEAHARRIRWVDLRMDVTPGTDTGNPVERLYRNDDLHALIGERSVEAAI